VHAGRGHGKDRRKGFTEADYARLLDTAHQQPGGPLVVVKDNLNTHVSRAMAELIAAQDWLTALIKTRLKRMQYRPDLLDGFLASTGLGLTPFRNPTNKDL
jgi:putative transposase